MLVVVGGWFWQVDLIADGWRILLWGGCGLEDGDAGRYLYSKVVRCVVNLHSEALCDVSGVKHFVSL